MASIARPTTPRIAQHIADLYGDDTPPTTLHTAMRQAAEAVCIHTAADPERLRKALALVQAGAVTLQPDGTATVHSGEDTYTINGTCSCPDAQQRGVTWCKHALAVQIHKRTVALLDSTPPAASTPSASAASPAAASPPAADPAAKARASKRPHPSAAWAVTEAPTSSCFKVRIGNLEWTHTIRAHDDDENQARLGAFLPLFREIVATLEALHTSRQAAHEAAKAALQPAEASAPLTPPALPGTPEALQALIAQSVQQALAAQAPPPPSCPATPAANGAAPSRKGKKSADQESGWCSIHNVQMDLRQNERGTWHSHWDDENQEYCRGAK